MNSVLNIHWKDWCWSWNSNILVTWCKELTHLKRRWYWERLKAGGEQDDRGEMVGWHHRLDGHEFEQALGVGNGQGSLAYCSPWDCKDSDTTERLNWTECSKFLSTVVFYSITLYLHHQTHPSWASFLLWPSSFILSGGVSNCLSFFPSRASLVAQRIKHLPAMRETWAWSLGGEDPLEKEVTTHSSIVAWRIPWTEKSGRLQSTGHE